MTGDAGAGNDEVAKDLALFGASQAVIDQVTKEPDDADYLVDPDNWDTVRLFLSVQTQWILGAMGGYVGLNYPAIDVDIKRLELTVTPDSWAGLKVMERAALKELNKSDG